MSPAQIEIQLVAVVVAMACALPGVFVVLRKVGMMTDAISHAILPGIVVGFFLTGSLHSPVLIIAAAGTGLLTVALVEGLRGTHLVKEDAAIGIVFPALFSIGVILIAQYAGDVHLDTDVVLLGELAFAPFDRLTVGEVDLGPRALYVVGAAGLLTAGFITLFYKELKLSTFDAGLAAALGFAPGMLHYALMGLVSLTAVTAFDAVGAILVVAMMVGPPAAAHLLTDRLEHMIGWSLAIGAGSAVAGYWLAHALDASIAGAMATMIGVSFAAAFLLAPERGVLAQRRRRREQRWRFAVQMLAVHLHNHTGTPAESRENRIDHLSDHLDWAPEFAREVVHRADDAGLLTRTNGHLHLTDAGHRTAEDVLA